MFDSILGIIYCNNEKKFHKIIFVLRTDTLISHMYRLKTAISEKTQPLLAYFYVSISLCYFIFNNSCTL